MTARLLIVGPQGSGKGTQGIRIADAFGIPAISTGDMFRAAVASGSDLGTQVTEIIQAGNLVPDELTSAVVRDRLSQTDAASGFLLDGYPRNLGQVDRPRRVPRRTRRRARRRDRTRRAARGEHRAAHGQRAAEQGRTDDTEEVIANRLAIYERETAPILDVYRERGIALEIDGVGSLDEITDRVIAALEERGLIRSAAA